MPPLTLRGTANSSFLFTPNRGRLYSQFQQLEGDLKVNSLISLQSTPAAAFRLNLVLYLLCTWGLVFRLCTPHPFSLSKSGTRLLVSRINLYSYEEIRFRGENCQACKKSILILKPTPTIITRNHLTETRPWQSLEKKQMEMCTHPPF